MIVARNAASAHSQCPGGIGHVPLIEYENEHYSQINSRQQSQTGELTLHKSGAAQHGMHRIAGRSSAQTVVTMTTPGIPRDPEPQSTNYAGALRR